MEKIKTQIIPKTSNFAKNNLPQEINYQALCIFSATGFFLDQDTYWKNQVVLRPSSINKIDEHGFLIDSKPWFKWYYTPRDISFDRALNEFSSLFETIIDEQTNNKQVILPLSGGLDSRTQALALHRLNKNVESYSYNFKNGYNEVKIAREIAKICNFNFKGIEIEKGYLWNTIEELSEINGCYSEFTNPRQMVMTDFFKNINGIFSLGHWGDVLFDKGAETQYKEDELPQIIVQKILKKGGLELGEQLWQIWEIEGSFLEYLTSRIKSLLDDIKIKNSSAKVRAFKSLYWAPRWTSVNLSIFEKFNPISLPYYDDRMCEFICTVPEQFLADRKLQIAYIKKHSKELAKITWQEHKPFNLYNFKYNKNPYNLPYRVYSKISRELNASVGRPLVQRNWESQFLGADNDMELKKHIFDESLNEFIPKSLFLSFYKKFKEDDAVFYSHPLSMLLTLGIWYKNQKYG